MTSQTLAWLTPAHRASRGIGLELTKQLISSSSPKHTVIASCRDPAGAKDLQALAAKTHPGTVHIVQLDAGDETSIRNSVSAVAAILGDRGLDYLYNNGAIVCLLPACIVDASMLISPSCFFTVGGRRGRVRLLLPGVPARAGG